MADPQDQPDSESNGTPPEQSTPPETKPPAKAAKKTPAKKAAAKKAVAKKAPPKKAPAKKAPATSPAPTPPKAPASRQQLIVGSVELVALPTTMCQSALDRDPLSASKRDPFEWRVRPVALAPSELAGVAETERARACA